MNAAEFVTLMAPVGPVAEAFVADESMICGIMGPVGSAKTTTMIRKMVLSCGLQPRSPRDGIRRARWCVVRDTYAQMQTNFMASWFTWFPKEMGTFNGDQMSHTVRLQINRMDGGEPETWEIQMLFRAMGDQKAEQVLKGLELTGLALNEMDTLDPAVMSFGIGRIGRYPSAVHGGCGYRAVIGDFNAPEIDNWTYDLLVERKLPIPDDVQAQLREKLGERFNIGFHRQPGGRSVNPQPENIQNLPVGYYEMQLLGMPDYLVRRLIDNEFGPLRNGQPVYPEFNDDIHVAKLPLEPAAGVPVGIGFDGGSTPAAVFGQRMPNGQVRDLSELVVFADSDSVQLERMGPVEFGKMMGEHWLEFYASCQFEGAWFDPAALYGDEHTDSWARLCWKAFIETVSRLLREARHWRAKPAPVKGNRLPERLECVRRGLTTMVGGQPMNLTSPSCRFLRRGFNSGYVITRVQTSAGQGRWKDEPTKNDFSHVHDAKQYLTLGLTKRGAQAEVLEGRDMRGDRVRRRGPKVNFGSGAFAHRDGAAVRTR